jgi:SAM-dependent methyltransferase
VTVLRQVWRVLKPGGHFCFDTPNRNVTRLGSRQFVVDDHKYEYTHKEMTALLEGNGFVVREAKGLTLMDQSVREGRFIEKEAMGRDRLYDDIENCFLLYYKAQKV